MKMLLSSRLHESNIGAKATGLSREPGVELIRVTTQICCVRSVINQFLIQVSESPVPMRPSRLAISELEKSSRVFFPENHRVFYLEDPFV